MAMSRREDAVAVGARDGACRAPQRPEFDAVDIQPAPRLFLCARCFSQVALCRHCDRGQRYCGQACSAAARRERQKEAGQRYQRGARGRAMHAERARRWREGRRTAVVGISVTHQGQPEAAEALQTGVPIGTVTIGDPIAMAPRPGGGSAVRNARVSWGLLCGWATSAIGRTSGRAPEANLRVLEGLEAPTGGRRASHSTPVSSAQRRRWHCRARNRGGSTPVSPCVPKTASSPPNRSGSWLPLTPDKRMRTRYTATSALMCGCGSYPTNSKSSSL